MNGLVGALCRMNLEFTYYQRKVCFLNNMLNTAHCLAHRIMALYLHSNVYKLLCKSAGVVHMLLNIISGVILGKSFMMHMFCSFCCCSHVRLYNIVVRLTVLHLPRRW